MQRRLAEDAVRRQHAARCNREKKLEHNLHLKCIRFFVIDCIEVSFSVKIFPLRHFCRWLLVFWVSMSGSVSVVSLAVSAPKQDAPHGAVEDSTWRKTRMGWQDSALWNQPDTTCATRGIERVHPAVVAGLILLASIGSLFWASKEWEFVRLFEGDQYVCRRAQPRTTAAADKHDRRRST